MAARPAALNRLRPAFVPAGAPVRCSKTFTPVGAEIPRMTDVGEVHSAANEGEIYTYGQTADSDISVGVSENGTNWKASGSVHVGGTESYKVTWKVGANVGRRVRTQMGFQRFDVSWVPRYCGADSQEARAVEWLGGRAYGKDVHYLDGHCDEKPLLWRQPFTPGGYWQRNSGRQIAFSGAVMVFGVSLSARSGWSTNVVSRFLQGGGTHHWYCGSDGPTKAAQRIFAGL